MIKRIPTLLCALFVLLVAATSHAGQIITATITVTNAPTVNGLAITVNGDTRTWTNNTSVGASTLILTNSTAAGSATNLFGAIANYPFSALDLNYSSSTAITLRTHIGGALAVSLSGSWATVTLSTNTTDGSYLVGIPLSNYSSRTNTATRLVDGINSYSTNPITATFSGTAKDAIVTNSEIRGGTLLWTFVPNSYTGPSSSTNGLIFKASSGAGSTNAYWLVADAFGWPAVHDSAGGSPLITPEDVNGLVTLQYVEATYPHLGNGASPGVEQNNWNAQNNFYSFRVTNAVIQAGIITGTNTNSFYYGTIGTLSGGTVSGTTISGSTLGGTISTLSGGVISGAGLTNVTGTNSTFAGTTAITGTTAFTRTNHTALANGPNSGIDFSGKTFVKLKAGPTAAFSICGIIGGSDGRELRIYNSTAQAMTIANESGSEATPANRILTNTGADVVTTAAGFVTLIYDSDQSRWILESVQM